MDRERVGLAEGGEGVGRVGGGRHRPAEHDHHSDHHRDHEPELQNVKEFTWRKH